MRTHVTYLFDPLCGWCYGASAVIQRLSQQPSLRLELAPTGLFAGAGRVMDAAFAVHAWANDQRIAELTGLPFSGAYRRNVLDRPDSLFDSSVATRALTAVALNAPSRELEMLKALQDARYVQGLDICDVAVVEMLLREQGLATAANRLATSDAELLAANAARIRKARRWMQTFGAQGVPALVVSDDKGSRLLSGDALYGGFDKLLREVAVAAGSAS